MLDHARSYQRAIQSAASNLQFANLEFSDLDGIDLRRADLTGAQLYSTHARWAKFNCANLNGVNLRNVLLNIEDIGSRAHANLGPGDSHDIQVSFEVIQKNDNDPRSSSSANLSDVFPHSLHLSGEELTQWSSSADAFTHKRLREVIRGELPNNLEEEIQKTNDPELNYSDFAIRYHYNRSIFESTFRRRSRTRTPVSYQ